MLVAASKKDPLSEQEQTRPIGNAWLQWIDNGQIEVSNLVGPLQ